MNSFRTDLTAAEYTFKACLDVGFNKVLANDLPCGIAGRAEGGDKRYKGNCSPLFILCKDMENIIFP